MTWFKVDDGLAFHAKVVLAGNPAMGLWVRAGSWSAQQLTDGFIPDHIVTSLGTKAQARALGEARLWIRGTGGWQFHGWNEDGRQPTREQVEKERSEARARMKRAREARRGSEDVQANTERTSADVRVTRPVPSRPVPPLEQLEGGTHVSSAHENPLPGRCSDHQYDVVPPKCGACKDARLAAELERNRQPLRLVTDTKRCLVHDLTYVELCNGCEADRKGRKETA